MRVLFVDSGAFGFHLRYAYDIYNTLIKDFHYQVRQVAPQNLTPELVKQFRPNLLLVVHGTLTPLSIIRFAKARGIITVLWLVEDPYEIDFHRGEMVRTYDFIFTNEKQALKEYSHARVFYLPWCCNPAVHKRFTVGEAYQSDLCFVGMGFSNRVRILNAVTPLLKNLKVKLIGDWQSWGAELHSELRQFVIPVIHNLWEVQKFYNGAKINLNIHRDPLNPAAGNRKGVGASSPNDRAFALAGCGAYQLVDYTRPDLWECFTEGEEIVGFTNPDELAIKIEEAMAKPAKRNIIGTNAQRTAYARHTFKHRLAEIIQKVGRYSNKITEQGSLSQTNQPLWVQPNLYSAIHSSQSQTKVSTHNNQVKTVFR